FIPYEQFSNVTYLAKGGFSEIYKATCSYDTKEFWDNQKKEFETKNVRTIVLKSLNNSKIISNDFLNELKNYFQCSNSYVLKYYGITQHPETKNYLIVMAFASNDLHSGNILVDDPNSPLNASIGDFGISKPANSITDTKEIYG
ncbi:3428_t:CDS:2, partial [Racocetra fulgida]